MSTQSLALSAAEAVSEEDYQALLAALSASARGRAFLDEHARRQRAADTAALLVAVERLEAHIAAQPSRADIANELNALAESVRAVQSQIDAVQLAAAVTKLAATLETVQQRLPTLPVTPAAEPALAVAAAPEPARETKPVEAPFALALTAVAAQAIAAAQEEEPVKIIRAGTIPAPPPFTGEDFRTEDAQAADEHPAPLEEHATQHSTAGHDMLMQIKALSEEERLALFS
jgi:hypothetical protein